MFNRVIGCVVLICILSLNFNAFAKEKQSEADRYFENMSREDIEVWFYNLLEEMYNENTETKNAYSSLRVLIDEKANIFEQFQEQYKEANKEALINTYLLYVSPACSNYVVVRLQTLLEYMAEKNTTEHKFDFCYENVKRQWDTKENPAIPNEGVLAHVYFDGMSDLDIYKWLHSLFETDFILRGIEASYDEIKAFFEAKLYNINMYLNWWNEGDSLNEARKELLYSMIIKDCTVTTANELKEFVEFIYFDAVDGIKHNLTFDYATYFPYVQDTPVITDTPPNDILPAEPAKTEESKAAKDGIGMTEIAIFFMGAAVVLVVCNIVISSKKA